MIDLTNRKSTSAYGCLICILLIKPSMFVCVCMYFDSEWSIVLFESLTIGQINNFGFGFTKFD